MTSLLKLVAPALTPARPLVTGQVTSVVGLSVTVGGLRAAVGDLVRIESAVRAGGTLPAEVGAINGDRLTCLPLGQLTGVAAGARVFSTGGPLQIAVGHSL